MAITTASQSQIGQETAKNSQIVTTSVRLVNSGASTGSPVTPTVSSIIVTDSGYNNVSANLTSTNSYIKIFGTNFQSNSNVYVQNTLVSSANVSYISSSELRVALPVLLNTGTNLFLSVINPINYNYSSSTFIDLPPLVPNVINYLVVAGAGAGGGHCGGGGGAGGLLYSNTSTITSSSYTVSVTVGAGAAVSPGYPSAPYVRGGNGTNSSLVVFGNTTQTITSTGGGGGGTRFPDSGLSQGASGGSGGGGSNEGPTTAGSGIGGQGNNGGNGHESDGRSGGGGGGAGSGGVAGAPYAAGNGGSGLQLAINGTNTYYSAGGGGGLFAPATAGLAGTGGNGNGGANAVGTSGTANRGHGGGGGVGGGGAGGSGIVIIRWPESFGDPTSSTGSPIKTTADGHTIYTFNSSGTLTFGA
jgi:hypothetical protein